MNRFFYFIFSFSLFFNTFLVAQSITWQRVLNNNNGTIKRIQQTFNGCYIAIGSDYIGSFTKIYLVKLDNMGNTIWTRIIGGNSFDNGYWVEETTDRGYIIGASTLTVSGDLDAFLVKTDSAGFIQWQKNYTNSDMDQCFCVKQTSDGGFILACRIFPEVVGTWFIKTDNYGNIIWQKIYYNPNFHISVYREIQILNDGYVSVGWITEIPQQQTDACVMRLNLNGDTIWMRIYGGSRFDGGYSIDKIDNRGFIVGGISNSFNAIYDESYLIKTDANGNVIWQKTYSNNPSEYYESCYSVIYKQNTGFVMAGESDTTEVNLINSLIRIIDTNGVIVRQKLFYPEVRGGWFNNINNTSDGGFIVGGNASTQIANKMYIVKTDSLLEANPIGIIKENENIPEDFTLYQNYPNPFNSQTKIKLYTKRKAKIKILIYDITGKIIKNLINSDLNIGFHNFIFSTEDLKISSAVYFYSLFIDNSDYPLLTKKLTYLK